MKKILTDNMVENTRRQPFTKATYDHLQEAFREVFEDIFNGLTSNAAGVTILHGCVDSDADANDWDISAGALLYQGEVFRIDAFVGSDPMQVPVLSIVETYHANDPVKFTDNNDFNVHQIRKMQWTLGASGSGIADFDELLNFKNSIADYNKTETLAPINGWAAYGAGMVLQKWGKVHVLSGLISPGAATSRTFLTNLPAGFSEPYVVLGGSWIGKMMVSAGALGGLCDIVYISGPGFKAVESGTEDTIPAGGGTEFYGFSITWISN